MDIVGKLTITAFVVMVILGISSAVAILFDKDRLATILLTVLVVIFVLGLFGGSGISMV